MPQKVPLVLQAAPADCGPACMAMMLSTTRQHAMTVEEIDKLRDHAGRDGMSVASLRRVLDREGLPTKAIRVRNSEALTGLPQPQILFWDENHFLVANKYARKHVELADPAFGRRRVTWAEFNASFSKIAIVPAAPTPAYSAKALQHHNAGFRIRYMLQLSSGQARRRLLTVGLMTVLLDLLALSTVFLLRFILANAGLSIVATLIAALLSLAVLEVAGRSLRGLLIARTHTAAETHLHTDLFQLLLHLDWSFFSRRSKGDLLSRLEFVRELYAKLFNDSVLAAFSLGTSVIILGVLTALSPVAGASVVVLSAACLLAARLARGNFVAVATSAVEARVRLGSFAEQVLQGVEGLKGVRGEDAVCAMWREQRARLAAATHAHRNRVNILDAVQSAITRVSQVVVVALVALTSSGAMSGANLFAILSLSGMAIAPVLLATRSYVAWGELESYIIRFNDLLDRRPAAVTSRLSEGFEEMAIDSVSFAFGGAPAVIEDLTFRIQAGEHIGIWAPSGTGKTTLLRLLSGSLQPTAGSIRVNGVPLSHSAAQGFFCGVVPQEVSLISGTIADNLRVGAPAASDEELRSACALAGLGPELERMPKGLYTRLSANGGGISGGQRQRIAIARAVLSQPDLLMLDEATAALDYETEQAVIHNLAGRTLIVVSHREELMAQMDRVIYLTRPGRAA
jgi:ATP-binding cassette subfamily B protein